MHIFPFEELRIFEDYGKNITECRFYENDEIKIKPLIGLTKMRLITPNETQNRIEEEIVQVYSSENPLFAGYASQIRQLQLSF